MFLRTSARGVGGSLGRHLATASSIAEIRAASPLPDDAQRVIDQALIEVQLDRLSIVASLMGDGLVYTLDNALAVPELYQEKINQTGHARRVMNPSSRGENRMVDRTGYTIPIYLTMDTFELNARPLAVSRRVGAPLDTTMVAQATRRVNESLEDAVINGPGVQFNGHTAYGLLNEPNVNSVSYVSNESWSASGHDGADIYADVMNMVEELDSNNYHGPYVLQVPTAYWLKLNDDWKANSDKTILQRLTELRFGNQPLRIEQADMLPADRTIMYQPTRDVLELVVGQMPTVVSWADGPGWEFNFAVMSIVVPRIKSTYTGQSGVVKGYTS